MELAKTYDPRAAEERWFQVWIDRGYFKADPVKNAAAEPFSMVIAPPNITGQLHLGHALELTLQDTIARTRRMQGYDTLWLPGTDHAGIATQNAVEKELAKQGTNRHQLGRDAEKVSSVLPLRSVLPYQAQVRLVNQRGALQGVVAALAL